MGINKQALTEGLVGALSDVVGAGVVIPDETVKLCRDLLQEAHDTLWADASARSFASTKEGDHVKAGLLREMADEKARQSSLIRSALDSLEDLLRIL